MLEQNQGRARFKLAVFCGFALHILFVGGLLMVGCKKDQGADQQAAEQNTTGGLTEDTNIVSNIDTNLASGTVVSNDPHLTPPPVPATNEIVTPGPGPVTPSGAGSEYVVTKGDSFSTIAKKTGVSAKAIQDANPTVVPTKLKVGQKLQIPPPSSSAAPTVSGSAPSHSTTVGGATTYTVKSGDSLTKIASKYGVSIKALRSANNMKTDRIKVGDKLKIPATSSAAPVETPAAVDTSVPSTSTVPSLPPPAPNR
jgi:LysM repeat protein